MSVQGKENRHWRMVPKARCSRIEFLEQGGVSEHELASTTSHRNNQGVKSKHGGGKLDPFQISNLPHIAFHVKNDSITYSPST